MLPSPRRAISLLASTTPVWAVLWLGCPRLAAAELDDLSGAMPLRGRSVRPMGRLEFADGAGRVQVAAELGAGYDSNVRQTRNDVLEDSFLLAAAGLRLAARAPLGVWRLDTEIVGQDYREEDGRDRLDATIAGSWTLSGRRERIRLGASAAVLEDPLPETGRTVRRSHYNATASYQQRGRVTAMNAEFTAQRIDFLEDSGNFDRDERDRWRADLGFGVTHELGSASQIGTRLRLLGVRYDDDDSRFQDALGVALAAFWNVDLSDRIRLEIEPGVAWRQHEDDFSGDAAYDDEVVIAPELRVSCSYQPNPDFVVSLRGSSNLGDGAASNAATLSRVSLEARRELDRRFAISASVARSHREDSGAADGDPDSVRRSELSSALAYLPRDGLRAEVAASFADQDGPDGHRRWLVTLSLVGAF